jgi:hypothetical protein
MTPANLDALIERLNDFSCGRGCFDTLVGDCREAAAALAELRDAEAGRKEQTMAADMIAEERDAYARACKSLIAQVAALESEVARADLKERRG